MVEVWLFRVVSQRPIGNMSALLLDHGGQVELPWQWRKGGNRDGCIEECHRPSAPIGAIRPPRYGKVLCSLAVFIETIGGPAFGRREIEFDIIVLARFTQEHLEASRLPQTIRPTTTSEGGNGQSLGPQQFPAQAQPTMIDAEYGGLDRLQRKWRTFRMGLQRQSSQIQFSVLGARPKPEGTMTSYTSSLLRSLEERGYIHQLTDAHGLDKLANEAVIPGYIGFDATAPSLHVGSLVQIMLLRRLQQAGHKPIVVMGGGTTKVGDPSGKDESRKMLTAEGIQANIASIRTVFERLLVFGDGPTDAVMVDNDEWLSQLGYVDLLREVGPHFTINRMLTFDSVKLRLDREQPLTFLEFNYMILQAYDFRELALRHGCRLQMGGSDQWGNIINGIELTRRMEGKELFGLTTPLLTTADGSKMGKTASGAVWLNEDQLPAYDFWQYWRNTDDRDVGRFLRLFTDLPLDEIARLESLEGSEINSAKVVLATEITKLCRGESAASAAEATAAATFSGGGVGQDLPVLALPDSGIGIIDALVGIGFAASRGEAKRLIAGGGARIDGASIADENYVISGGSELRISSGKKRHGILRPA